MTIRLSGLADAELWSEAAHLESERPGWGLKLIDRVLESTKYLSEHPGLATRIEDPSLDHDVYRHVLRQFPFSLIIAELQGKWTIIAVAADRREPGYWKDRLERERA